MRKATKDQKSTTLAKMCGDLDILVAKATSHENEPADEKYANEILCTISSSNDPIFAISKRLSRTKDRIVALKALMLVHRLLNDGGPVFLQQLKKGEMILDMSNFRDEAHSGSWDHSSFVRAYALYLDQKVEFMIDEKKETDKLEKLRQSLRLLDRFLACKPTGAAKISRMVLVALSLLVKESFKVYGDLSDVLKYFLDCFSEMDYGICVEVFDAYVNAKKKIDELSTFYYWCKDVGVVRSSQFPQVVRISDKVLGSLEGLLREKANRPKSTNNEERLSEIKETTSMNEIKALPPPDVSQLAQNWAVNEDNLVSLKEDKWAKFPNVGRESGWEIVLVESDSNFSNQKSDLGGGFDALVLNGMYEHGRVRQHAQIRGGSASSVAFPGGLGKVLALPGPDGVGQPDPFAASLLVPPPAYVQIADMEKKQQLLAQEQQLWQHYVTAGQRGYGISNDKQGYYYTSY